MLQRSILRQSRLLGLRTVQTARFAPLASRLAPSVTAVPRIPAQRLYSSETEAAKPKVEDNGAEAAKTEDPVEALKTEIKAKDEEILSWKDKYLRSVADFRNLQERTKRDMQSAKDYAIQQFAKDLVESVDNFDRALDQVSEEKRMPSDSKSAAENDLAALFEGIQMTEKIFMQTLKKHGLERFDPSVEGVVFNPNEHEALFMAPMPDKEHNTVFHTQSKGFKLNGRILRAAKVGIVKNE